jgi:long-chain acyl-CoA synthetase
MIQTLVLDVGGTLVFWSGDSKRIVADLAEAQPTHLPAVPRIYEKVHTAVMSTMQRQSPVRRAIFRWALAEGGRYRRRERAGGRPGPLASARHGLADRLVLSKVRGVFGPRLIMGIVGAAPISRDLLEFFDACGVLVLEGWGMTETCSVGTLNPADAPHFGTIGRPMPGCEMRIAADGELLTRGPHVFCGYYRNPEGTAEVMKGDWLRSGDLGSVSEDGYVSITGRKKDLIITSSGKNIAPQNIETGLRDTRWISHAVVYGDQRPYLVCPVTLDSDEAQTSGSGSEISVVCRHFFSA